ncbi:MAG: BRCT domain-containing protein, partial [Candidatus Hodarchaeales archaeon]
SSTKRKKSPNLTEFFSTKNEKDTDTKTPPIGEGKRIYVTGKIPGMSKKEVQALIENLGFEWSNSISKKLDFLVVGEKPGAKKLSKAKDLKIPLKDWKDFKSEYL